MADEQETIRRLWAAMGAWFQTHAPPCYERLHAAEGASAEAIALLETQVGSRLPDDFAAYLRLYNAYYGLCFFEYSGFDTVHIARNWQMLKELTDAGTFARAEPHVESDERMQACWWHPGWIPFAEDGGGNLICLDLAPAARGTWGQVFYWEIHGGPEHPCAPSFLAYLKRYHDDLLSGRYTYDAYTGTFNS